MARVSTKKVVKKVSKNEEKSKCKKTLGEKILKKLGLKKERRGRPKKRKGFTLIELLAVIVILGLLMAIAIPSVTRYITTSRKKTLTTTMGNYTSALVNEVNDSEYTLTASNTVYAIPIECISLERGGNNPLGEWSQANDKYFAYVLVQYDDLNSSYNYGFTFKDSNGYGMYPTSQNKLSGNDKNIKTGLSLTRPVNGKITSLTRIENWGNSGFVINEDTEIVVLQAESEGKLGDGKTTCTLQQKGSNYAQIEEEKEKLLEERYKDYALKNVSSGERSAFWKYKSYIKTVTFQDSLNVPSSISDDYKWDVSWTGNGKVMAYIVPNSSHSSYYDLYIQGDGELYANPNSSHLFNGFVSLEKINNANVLNTKYVVDMNNMFFMAGDSADSFVADLSSWNTSKVTNMKFLFAGAGQNAYEFSIGDLSNWDTSNVTDMSHMFDYVGQNDDSFNVGNLGNWDVSNVTDMSYMFYSVGYYANEINLDLSNWDTSSVQKMDRMFIELGYEAISVTLNLSNWNTVSVIDMSQMFNSTGSYSNQFNLIGLNTWNTSNVKNMNGMFTDMAKNANTFSFSDLSNWNTSNVIDMNSMFMYTGQKASYSLDISGWNVDNVTKFDKINKGVESKIELPSKFK